MYVDSYYRRLIIVPGLKLVRFFVEYFGVNDVRCLLFSTLKFKVYFGISMPGKNLENRIFEKYLSMSVPDEVKIQKKACNL